MTHRIRDGRPAATRRVYGPLPSPNRLHDPGRLAWTGVAGSELDDRKENTGPHGFRDERRAPSAGYATTARYFQVPYTPPHHRPRDRKVPGPSFFWALSR
jgi:hypothetical protein